MTTLHIGYDYDAETDVLEVWYSVDRDFVASFDPDGIVELSLATPITSDSDLPLRTETGLAAWAEISAFLRVLHDDLSALRSFHQFDEQVRGIQ